MSVELLQNLSMISFIIAGVLLLVGIALFFLLDIPKLYGDVSGRTAKKAIEAIRQQNETTGDKAYKLSPVNAARGKLTDKITQSGRLQPQTAGLPISVGTEKFATSMMAPQLNETTVLETAANETTVLTGSLLQSGETTLLMQEAEQSGETTLLVQEAEQSGETTLLMQEVGQSGETAHLSQEINVDNVQVGNASGFSVDVEMGFTGSSEIIE